MATNVTQILPDVPDLTTAVHDAIKATRLTPADAGAVKLAREYSAAIDQASDRADALERLGPKLLTALGALGATPAARAKATNSTTGGHQPSKLGQLREARRKA